LEKVQKSGWKGAFSFVSDIVICSFVGWVFYSMATSLYPHLAVIACSIGSYWGTKGFNLAKDWFINAVKANIK
jgi:hypothetical protein